MPIHTMPLGVTAVMLPDLDFDEQLTLCRRLGVTHYSLRPRVIPESQRDQPWSNWGNHKFDLTPQRLVKEAGEIRRKLQDAGMTPFGTVPSLSITSAEADLKLGLEGAQAVGAGRVRVAPRPVPEGPFDYQEELERNLEGFQRVVELARPYGQKVVIETHCRSLATSPGLALNLCRPFDPEHLGVIFDLANFNIEGYLQPHLAVSVLGPYIDHCHIGGARQVTGDYDALGFRRPGQMMCPLTEANLHMPSWIQALQRAGRDVPLIIEDFTPNRPGADRLTDTAQALRRALDRLDG